MDVAGQDIVVAEEVHPLEVAPEGVMRQFYAPGIRQEAEG